MLFALTHTPSPHITECQLTFLARDPIDYALARRQHRAYCVLLESCGVQVTALEDNIEHPDAVFIEDTAIVLDELALITHLGSRERQPETPAIAAALARVRQHIRHISAPATLEGGDVLQIAKTLYVGLSPRTNAAGIEALRQAVSPFGYQVIPVGVHGCLHLKTGVTALDDTTLLINSQWVDALAFTSPQHAEPRAFHLIPVAEDEPFAANTLRLEGTIIASAAFPHTAARIRRAGFPLKTIDVSEFAKAEGGLTCMSLLYH